MTRKPTDHEPTQGALPNADEPDTARAMLEKTAWEVDTMHLETTVSSGEDKIQLNARKERAAKAIRVVSP